MFANTARRSVFLTFVLMVLITSACKKQPENRAGKLPESVQTYVYGFTSGIISKANPIRVRFADAVVDSTLVGETAKNVISFDPAISGQAVWEDAKTLRFDPEQSLNSGTTYIATVELGKIVKGVPKDAQSFQFDFRTRDQYFEVQTNGYDAPNPKDLSKQEFSGTLFTADVAENENIEQTLTAKQNGKTLPIRWEHQSAQLAHNFVITEINRGNQPSEIELEWDGKPVNVVLRGEKQVEVPSLKDFKVTDARVAQDQEQYILLFFSDPLSETQNLDGLVSIRDYNGALRTVVDGNQVRIYPSERIIGERRIVVSPGVKNLNGKSMANPSEWQVAFEDVQPQVRLVGRGVIMPNSNGLIFPFEAISLTAVDVEVFKIYNNNILQFLQTNELDGNYDLYRVGRVVMQKRINLTDLNARARTSDWTRYALDLSKMIEQDPEAIYQVRIGFRPAYSTYFCNTDSSTGETADLTNVVALVGNTDENGEYVSIMDSWYGVDGWYDNYSWAHRENPCFPAYYNSDRFIQRNVIASNLGIVTKGGTDNSYFVTVSDLRTTEPMSGVTLEFYDFQQQLLTSAQTNGDGQSTVQLSRKPFVVVARSGEEKGYLRLEDGNALSLSRFEVEGEVTQKGLKGYLYGERGVWRPGDSVYLNFVLEDRDNKLPENYPITFELTDSRGQMQERRVVTPSAGDVYALYFETDPDAPTGSWNAKVKAGGAEFNRSVRIETVKPNRLSINLDFGKKELRASDEPLTANLSSSWLYGAPAKNLKAVVEVQLSEANTSFSKYKDFVFDDPARSFSAESKVIFDGTLDENGNAQFNANVLDNKLVPGKLSASFRTRVIEKGGDFSTDNVTLPYHPFSVYAGVAIPKGSWGDKQVQFNKPTKVDFVAVNTGGSPQRNRKLSVGLYRVEWRWWWDEGYDNVSRYNSAEHVDALQTQSVTTNAQGQASWNVTVSDWGRYLIRVCDTESGHCTGDYFYAGYPEDDYQARSAAAMLGFTADKEKYNVGETVTLTIPTGEEGKALITLENGTKVVESFWKDSKKGENKFTFKVTEEMTPNVYAHVELIQPHAQAKNDLPIRMYGVIPIMVEDPATRLNPVINMPNELKPEQTVTVEVSEKGGKAMAYTIDIVDEGLLGLTRFQTPNPWESFFAKEALGVKTWDVYDMVLGAYGGELERILSIGGDAGINRKAAQDRANRFKPVVIHLGPFELKRGQKVKHQVKIPNYIGAVRTMVVASSDNAYGSAEKMTPVKKPLMILATLPRVLGPGETLKLPVNVFAMESKVKNVNVSVKEKSGLVSLTNGASQSISFDKPGDGLVEFDVQVKENIGVAKFTITAQGGGETATQDIEIQVRNPNPIVTDVRSKVLNPGEDWSQQYNVIGMKGTNEGMLEVSNIPPINLGERLQYLLQYPYGCLEQTLSGGFPQLYVSKLMELNEQQKKSVPNNIKATIDRLKQFQTDNGGFAYWPGQSGPDQWSTSYAGHFLLEAKALGYNVPNNLLDRWENFQKKAARMWDPKLKDYGFMDDRSHELNQAYRLYTLALAKEPEMGAMNRLRETKNLSNAAKWRLAAAYAAAGKPEVAKSITQNLSRSVTDYRELSYTYGSTLRDQAMMLETMVLMGNKSAAGEMVRDVAEELSSQQWLSTQETAYALLAIGKFVGNTEVGKRYTFTYAVNGKSVNAGSTTPLMQIQVPTSNGGSTVNVKNTSQATIFARLILRGQPVTGAETASANNLNINVIYKTTGGETLDPSNIPQGTDFVAEVTVKHPGSRSIPYREMVLTQIFPSGWEILNTRMDNFVTTGNVANPDYQDFRDDRVNTFFDLFQNQSLTFVVRLNAAYQGRFYLPATACEAMYDNSITSRTPGRWVEVVGSGEI
ncbi:MAG: alpha-2-macroglobulin family protein [Saprospiraceae bacterium]